MCFLPPTSHLLLLASCLVPLFLLTVTLLREQAAAALAKLARDNDETRGAIVSSIVSDSPAAQAGFEREDIVLEINGEQVDGSRDLTRRVGAFSAGRLAAA